MRATGPGQSVQLLLDTVDILSPMHIPYVVVGALAVSFHGNPRATNDADALIWLERPGKSETALTGRLMDEGYRIDFRMGDIDDPVTGVIIVEDEYQNRVDLLLGIRGLDPDVRDRSCVATLQHTEVRFIGAEDLVAMKVSAGGLQDLQDARGILQVSGAILKLDLLDQLVSRYGAETKARFDSLLSSIEPEGI